MFTKPEDTNNSAKENISEELNMKELEGINGGFSKPQRQKKIIEVFDLEIDWWDGAGTS